MQEGPSSPPLSTSNPLYDEANITTMGETLKNNNHNNQQQFSTLSSPSQQQQQQPNYPIVEVIAPATLRHGYTFDVELNHEVWTVEVPYGGVTQGQTFRTKVQPKIDEPSSLFRIPIGLWKDNLGDFCKFGPCHSSFLLSCLFPLISLGQIYTRLELTWNGSPYPYPPNNKSISFRIMVGLTFLYMTLKQIINGLEGLHYHALYILNLIYMIIIMVLVGRTRRYIRERYDIPSTFSQLMNRSRRSGSRNYYGVDGDGGGGDDDDDEFDDNGGTLKVCCGEMEDYCLGGCCYPCVVSQMNRHTAMYDTYEGSCFNSNGLPKHAPTMI